MVDIPRMSDIEVFRSICSLSDDVDRIADPDSATAKVNTALNELACGAGSGYVDTIRLIRATNSIDSQSWDAPNPEICKLVSSMDVERLKSSAPIQRSRRVRGDEELVTTVAGALMCAVSALWKHHCMVAMDNSQDVNCVKAHAGSVAYFEGHGNFFRRKPQEQEEQDFTI